MHVVKFYVCLLTALIFCQQSNVSKKAGRDYKRLFNYAEKLSNAANPSDKTDREALQNYLSVVAILSASKADDHFLFRAYISTATFLQVLNRQKESIRYLRNAIELKEKLSDIRDSALFRPLVYCGNAYYQLDRPDSAAIFYNQAESIAEKYTKISELERLFNTLGVIAYSSGNYNKSITYYEKAISTLTSHTSYDNSFLVTYKNNLASAFKKLKRYKEALSIYQGLLAYHIETDKLLHNIGAVYIAMGQGAEAIKYLQQVKYNNQKKLNDLGRAYFEEKDYSNAVKYLHKAVDLNANENHGYKNTDYGITLKYLGDLWFEKDQTRVALTYYQKALNNLLFNFHATSLYENPAQFTSIFNAMELLETLSAKAIGLKKLYTESGRALDLEASLQTYLAFYKLANYVERVYDNDESRLLITDKKYASHQQPIEICMQLFRLTSNRRYIEQALWLDEENKANILSLYLQDAKLKAGGNVPVNLLQEETRLKNIITRISLNAAAEKDSTKLVKLNGQLNEYSIALLKVQKKIDEGTSYGRLKSRDKAPSIQTIQNIIPPKSAILSYHILDTSIICFIITNKNFEFFNTHLPADFYVSLKQFYVQAQLRDGNDRKRTLTLCQDFYHVLFAPAVKYVAGKKDLLIIPDAELNYLPFEMLAGNGGENLLRRFTITYNYSCTVLQNSTPGTTKVLSSLGMAPFTGDSSLKEFSKLPASRAEVETLDGTRLFGKDATKKQFVKDAHNFNIIHLATHAYANDQDPNKSFIAFYPAKPDSALNFKLYLPEIYNLKLDKTRLVVLSACESGVGELVNGEGLISLSRAFSYSGCDNIITSMWKADDASTAYISERLHRYLKQENSIADALQQAKLDYLNDDHIPATQKLPGYWAHLRLIGGFEDQPANYTWIIYAAVALMLSLLVLINRAIISKLIRLRFP